MKTTNIAYYIENLGNQTLGDELTTNSEGIVEHPDMECLDRSGNHRRRALYEVPKHVKDKVVLMAKKAGFTFNIYSRDAAKEDSLPKEYFGNLLAPVADPFKAARRARKKQAVGMPVGFIRGSMLAQPLKR